MSTYLFIIGICLSYYGYHLMEEALEVDIKVGIKNIGIKAPNNAEYTVVKNGNLRVLIFIKVRYEI